MSSNKYYFLKVRGTDSPESCESLIRSLYLQLKAFNPEVTYKCVRELIDAESKYATNNTSLENKFSGGNLGYTSDMQQMKIPDTGEIWHIDFVGPLGNRVNSRLREKFVLVAVEYVTGFCYALPAQTQDSETVKQFLSKLLTIFPIPTTIVSDDGAPFTAWGFKRFTKNLSIQWRYTSAYYPQANAKVERVNGLLKNLLKSHDSDFRIWPELLKQAIRSYNNTSTIYGFAPQELLFGFESHVDFKFMDLTKYYDAISTKLDVISLDAVCLRRFQIETISKNRKLVTDRRFHSRKMFKLLNDPKSNHNTFTVGEYVYKKVHQKRKKTDPSWDGPYIVTRATPKHSYQLRNMDGKILSASIKIKELRPCYQYYGSPTSSIGDYTADMGNLEKQLYSKILGGKALFLLAILLGYLTHLL